MCSIAAHSAAHLHIDIHTCTYIYIYIYMFLFIAGKDIGLYVAIMSSPLLKSWSRIHLALVHSKY